MGCRGDHLQADHGSHSLRIRLHQHNNQKHRKRQHQFRPLCLGRMQSSGEGADQRTHRAQEQETDGQRSEEEFVVLVLSKDGLERQQLEFPSQEQFEKEFRSAKKGNH